MLIAYISDWTTTNGNAVLTHRRVPRCPCRWIADSEEQRRAHRRRRAGPSAFPIRSIESSAVHRCRRGFSLWRIARMWLAVSSPAVLPHIDPSRARLRGCSLLSELVPWQFTIHLAHASRPLSRPVVRIVG